WYQLGGMYYLAWMIVIVSGLFLVAFYLPTKEQAFNSIIHIKEGIPFGSILRGLHKYGGDCMIIAATLRVYRMWFTAEYKNKGEITFVLALILLVIAMYSGLTGYLLIWNQRAFWATKVFATFPTYLDIAPIRTTWWIPDVIGYITQFIGNVTHQGQTTSQILMGGSSIGQATMTRFYSLHFAFSLILLTVTEIYFYKNRLKRMNLKLPAVLTLCVMLLIVSIILPAESGSRANPEVTPLPILSDWYFLALYQLLKYMDPYWATIWTLGIPFVTIGLSLIDFGPEKDPWKRPIFSVIGIMGAIEFLIFSMLIIANQANLDRDPPYWFAHMIICIAIGQFWHWGLYKQRLPMLFWVFSNIVVSGWYLFFWHCVFTLPGKVTTLKALEAVQWDLSRLDNPANLYWSLLWLGFSLLQYFIIGILFYQEFGPKKRRQAVLAVKGATS
ncbi:MAG: cytochrome b N-terminal domain-containing protein, partial [Cyanobacteria bacterium]|nr:cytochrome b N-terminal domain-containing protein [Cyanobacteriota bacterium]